MSNEVVVVQLPQEVEQLAQSVSVEKRTEVQNVLNSVFNGVSKMREALDAVNVADEHDKASMKVANTIRLNVRQTRLDAEKTFDAKRAEVQALMIGFKTEDALWLKAKQTMQILTKEIEEVAKIKETTAERIAAERAKADRLLKIEQMKQAVLEAELKAKKDAEIAAQKEAERIENERKAAEAKAAKAPLKTKMTVWVDSFEIADFESNPTADEIKAKFEAFKKWSKEQIAKL